MNSSVCPVGLSWLIGGSLQEVLTSIIFLFIKHPFDVGDRVNILKDSYTVKEIRLLSTVFVDSQGCLVQAPNVVLNTTVRDAKLYCAGANKILNFLFICSIFKTFVAALRCLNHSHSRLTMERPLSSWKRYAKRCLCSLRLKEGIICLHSTSSLSVCLFIQCWGFPSA